MDSKTGAAFGGCGCYVLVLLANVVLGAWTFSYDLWMIAGKTVPLWVNLVVGLFAGEVTVPVAVVLALLQAVGVIHSPLVVVR